MDKIWVVKELSAVVHTFETVLRNCISNNLLHYLFPYIPGNIDFLILQHFFKNHEIKFSDNPKEI